MQQTNYVSNLEKADFCNESYVEGHQGDSINDNTSENINDSMGDSIDDSMGDNGEGHKVSRNFKNKNNNNF